MAHRDLVVVGASAGGVEALKELVGHLPADFPAAIAVVLHVAPSATSVLPQILSRAGKLEAAHAVHGGRLEPGHIYVAPPDHHLLIAADRVRLSRGPRVNGHRPAVDPLFLSASRARGRRAVSVILSGVLDDGVNGSCAVVNGKGVALAQEPSTALYPGMPVNAIEHGCIHHALPLRELAATLDALVREEIPASGREGEPTVATDIEDELAMDPVAAAAMDGAASAFTCPDCHGALWEIREGQLARYRCRIGHSYGAESLFSQQSEKIEEALWAGYRALEESAALAKRLAERAKARGSTAIAARYEARYEDALERARTLYQVLQRGQLNAVEPSP